MRLIGLLLTAILWGLAAVVLYLSPGVFAKECFRPLTDFAFMAIVAGALILGGWLTLTMCYMWEKQ